MSDPVGGLLEGLLQGAETGYTFRETHKARKRRQRLDEELLTLRQLESRRAEAQAGREAARGEREATEFSQGQEERRRALALRTEVGARLAAPHRFATPGEFISGKQPSRVEAPPLSTEATVAQRVGEVMGRNVGVDPSDEEALLYGSGMAPPPAFHQRSFTQEDYLERIRETARLRRGPGTTTPRAMTRNQAAQVVAKLDSDYSDYDESGNLTKHYLTPRQREALIAKMTAGTITEDDIPDLPSSQGGPMVAPPIRVAPPPGRGGAPSAVPGTPQRRRTFRGAEISAEIPTDTADRRPLIELAKARLADPRYRTLLPEDKQAVLEDWGLEQDEIDEVLDSVAELE